MLGISETSSICPAVTWPLLLTVTLVYVPALSPDRAASTSWSRTSAEPSKLTASAVASPAAENARGVFRRSAVSAVPPVGLMCTLPEVVPT